MSTSMRMRAAAAVIAGGALVGTSLFVTAQPAKASYPTPTIHYCGSPLNPVSDDGPVTDGVHHNLEPLFGAQDNNLLHTINCNVLAGLLRL